MIFDIIILLLAVILLIWSFFRESRRRTLLRLLSLLFIIILVFMGNRIQSFTGTVTVSGSGSYDAVFEDIDKYALVEREWSPYFNIIQSDTAYRNSVYHFSDHISDNDIHIDEKDTGIDTAYADSGMIHVTIKAMSGDFIPCSLYAEGIEPIPLTGDTHIVIDNNTIKYLSLHCDDKNPFNEFFDLDGKPRILIADTAYSVMLQRNVFLLEGMYPEYTFSGALIRNNRIITSSGHYDGIIFIGKPIEDTVPYIQANPDKREDLYSIGMFLENRASFSRRIVNPFNSGRGIELTVADKFLLTLKNHLFIIMLLMLSIVLPVI